MTMIPTTDPPRTPRRRGKAKTTTVLDVAIPPSVNRLWRYNKAGRVYRSAAYEAWIDEAGWELHAQRPQPVSSPVRIVLRAGLPDRPRDLDNIGKAAIDLLQSHGLIRNNLDVVHLARNERREKPAHPEFTGKLNIRGVEYRLAAWVREKDGKKFFSIAANEIEQRPQMPPQRPAGGPTFRDDESIPFEMEWRG